MYKDLFRLYKRPSFFEGLTSFLNFGGKQNRYHYSRSEREADHRAIQSDWQHVGRDIAHAITEFEREYQDGERRSSQS